MTMRLALCAALLAAGCVDVDDEPEVGSEASAVAVTWTNLVGVSATGNDLVKTSGVSSWNAGAVSLQSILADGYMQFTTAETTTAKQAGLSNGNGGQSPADIDFAIRLRANRSVGVYEAGVLRGSFGRYVAADVFRVEVESGVVTYKKNGAVFYTSAVAPIFPLLVDTSLYTPGATLNDVVLVATGVTWQNVVGVSVAGNDLSKTATTNTWTAGASTVQTLTGDGYAEFVAGESNTAKAAGLSNGDGGQHYTDIDFAIRLSANGAVNVYEAGVLRGSFGAYVAGDRFRVEVSGGVVSYSKNGARPFYTSAVAPTFPLLVDTAFLTTGATIHDVVLVAGEDFCPAYDGTGVVCNGSYTIANQSDVAAISGCGNITGNLTIQAPGMVDVALPSLERVGGTINVNGSPDLRWLRLPELKRAGNIILTLNAAPRAVDLSRLRTVNSELATRADIEVSAPCLDSAGVFSTGEYQSGVWTTAYAPRLREVSTYLLSRVTAPALVTAGNVNADLTAPALATITGYARGQLTVPALVSVAGDVSARPMDAPNLLEIGGQLDYYDGQELPSLQRAGSIILRDAPVTDLPALVEVTGELLGGSSVPGGTCNASNPAATTVDLPSLERAGAVRLCWNGLQEVQLPQLELIDGQAAGRALTVVSTAMNSVEFPALTQIIGGGSVEMVVPSSFPVLTEIGGRLYVLAPMNAPALTGVARDLWLTAALTAPALLQVGSELRARWSVSLPALSGIGGILRADWTPSPSTISLPSLTTVDGISTDGAANLTALQLPSLTTVVGANPSVEWSGDVLITDTALTSLSMPVLATIPGDLGIYFNDSLTSIDFPSLTSLGPTLIISSNDTLPNCYATNLRDQLLANGWTGVAEIWGNNGTGSCP